VFVALAMIGFCDIKGCRIKISERDGVVVDPLERITAMIETVSWSRASSLSGPQLPRSLLSQKTNQAICDN
jgi:hypothetical protein